MNNSKALLKDETTSLTLPLVKRKEAALYLDDNTDRIIFRNPTL